MRQPAGCEAIYGAAAIATSLAFLFAAVRVRYLNHGAEEVEADDYVPDIHRHG